MFLCGACMVSPCLPQFSPDTPTSSHSSTTCIGRLTGNSNSLQSIIDGKLVCPTSRPKTPRIGFIHLFSFMDGWQWKLKQICPHCTNGGCKSAAQDSTTHIHSALAFIVGGSGSALFIHSIYCVIEWLTVCLTLWSIVLKRKFYQNCTCFINRSRLVIWHTGNFPSGLMHFWADRPAWMAAVHQQPIQ